MKWVKAHIIGILGTVIVHLVLAIIFMIFKITTFKPYLDTAVVINFEPEPVPESVQNDQNDINDADWKNSFTISPSTGLSRPKKILI